MTTQPPDEFPKLVSLLPTDPRDPLAPRSPLFDALVGRSAATREMADFVAKVARSNVSVLLEGETGVGKTFAAHLLHGAGPRAGEPLHVLNCAALPESLLESELFGCERGAFTGAVAARPGVFEVAGRGTVLLDEIGELPLASQAKLLGVLQERRFSRLGSTRAIELRARVLFATNRDLDAMVEAGVFREDLLFRVSTTRLRVPPLRERVEDIDEIARRVLDSVCKVEGTGRVEIADDALAAIRTYRWPGNVRELRGALERAVVLREGECLTVKDLPPAVRGIAEEARPKSRAVPERPFDLAALERRTVRAAMVATGGVKNRAAKLLGISRTTLDKKLKAIDDQRSH